MHRSQAHHTLMSSLLLTVVFLSACSSAPMGPAADQGTLTSKAADRSSTSGHPATSSDTATRSITATTALPAHSNPNSPLAAKRSVYFDFDVYTVSPAYSDVIERHGQYLAAHPSVAIKVEGHSDERGGAEYNLALGQKRAEAVLRALTVYGVKNAQVEPVSWGEAKPKASGHDESAWAQNRRADLRY